MFATKQDWLAGLNPEQLEAVVHQGGPLLVLAGAGSGKTGTLACRVAHLLGTGARPERLCLLTFSRRAAAEMLTRAGRMAGADTSRVRGGTFHAVGNQLLRRYGRHLGLSPAFTVMDQSDAADLLGLVRHELGLGSAKGRRFPRKETLASIYSRTVNGQERLATVLERAFPWCSEQIDGIRDVFDGYTARKREQQTLDFDDLLLCWRAVAGLAAEEFDHVLVDEYQDTNAIQADILAALCPEGRGLTAVGDDAQAIYSFRAATAKNILDFRNRFPGTTIVRLERNYRSTEPILAVANAVIAEAAEGYGKVLTGVRPGQRRPLLRVTEDESSQAEAVCDSVLGHREEGVDLRRQAVLFRSGHHSDLVELALARRDIPYVKYGGLAFLEAAHVKDLLALLRVLDNPWDELAWFRVLQLLDGVGPATARRIMDTAGVRGSDDPLVSPLARFLAAPVTVPAPARADLAELRAAWADCAEEPARPPAVQVGRLRRFLASVVERTYDGAAARIADLEQLEQAATRFSDRGRMVAELTLDPPRSTSELAGPPMLDDDWLVLSTVHSAKGGEWDVVHVIHAADGMFPSDMATGDAEGIEEERRLFYVAITRARDVLEITAPHRFHHHRTRHDDAHSYGQLSRFLSPVVRSLLDEEWHAPPLYRHDVAVDGGAPLGGMATIDGLLADLWRS